MNNSNIIGVFTFSNKPEFCTVEKSDVIFLCHYSENGDLINEVYLGSETFREGFISRDQDFIYHIGDTIGTYSFDSRKIKNSSTEFDVEKIGSLAGEFFFQRQNGEIVISEQVIKTFPPSILSTYLNLGLSDHEGDLCLFDENFDVKGKSYMDSLGAVCVKWNKESVIVGESRGPLKCYDLKKFESKNEYPSQDGWNFLEIGLVTKDAVIVLSKDFETMSLGKVERIVNWQEKEELFTIIDAPLYLKFSKDVIIGSNRLFYDGLTGEEIGNF
ncbi:MAG: hypothetical protein P1V20_13250 [Verrucomicrobiales bacterium]|nr:hypothetical protein [Verrucomicrobiales bacterium]